MLKNFFVIILFVSVSTQVFATNSSRALDFLEEKIILDRLNDVCGDTWCEGEYNIIFTSVSFNTETQSEIKPTYKINIVAQNSYSAELPKLTIFCEIENVTLIQKIIYNTIHSQFDPSEAELFNLVDICLGEKLSSKPNP